MILTTGEVRVAWAAEVVTAASLRKRSGRLGVGKEYDKGSNMSIELKSMPFL